jgi:repressor LexA
MNYFSQNIRFLREHKLLKQVDIEGFTGIKRTTWNNYEKGRSEPEIDLILDISTFFGVSAEDLLRKNLSDNVHLNTVSDSSAEYLKSPPKSPPISPPNTSKMLQNGQIPLIPIDAIAGYGNGDVQVHKNEIEMWISAPNLDADYAIKCSGDSMANTYEHGDFLACKKVTDLFLQWGKAYVLDTEQGAIVKRLYKSENEKMIECRSDNPKYPPFEIPKKAIRSISIITGLARVF